MIELPLMLGLGLVAPEAIRLILGPKWSAVVSIIRWLVLFMTLRTLATLIEQVLISQRATRVTMRMSLWNLVVMPAAFFLAARWEGADGVAAAWIVLAPPPFSRWPGWWCERSKCPGFRSARRCCRDSLARV